MEPQFCLLPPVISKAQLSINRADVTLMSSGSSGKPRRRGCGRGVISPAGIPVRQQPRGPLSRCRCHGTVTVVFFRETSASSRHRPDRGHARSAWSVVSLTKPSRTLHKTHEEEDVRTGRRVCRRHVSLRLYQRKNKQKTAKEFPLKTVSCPYKSLRLHIFTVFS